MKKIASVLLAVLVAFSMFSFVVSAADVALSVTADKTNVKVGDTVTVTVKLSEKSGLGVLTIKANYDSSVLKAVEMTAGDLGATVNVATGIATMATATTFEEAGTVCVMTFEAVKAGEANVTFDVTEAYDNDLNEVALQVGTAKVTVAADEPTTDEPTTDEPTTDEPSTDEPSTDDPTTECKHETMSKWAVTTKATCKKDGVETRNCTVCDYSETRPIPATGNCAYKWVVTKEATATEYGEKVLKCTMCGDVKETQKLAVKTDSITEPAIPNTDAIA